MRFCIMNCKFFIIHFTLSLSHFWKNTVIKKRRKFFFYPTFHNFMWCTVLSSLTNAETLLFISWSHQLNTWWHVYCGLIIRLTKRKTAGRAGDWRLMIFPKQLSKFSMAVSFQLLILCTSLRIFLSLNQRALKNSVVIEFQKSQQPYSINVLFYFELVYIQLVLIT